ncbi:Hypothetical protein, putative [Bodo saltans]|uniref:Uncharacterized protein n=1 Tax=Bodo saltans TaxID=75058 RepID=A0A0S4JUR7_BODSA|nr:Hypothetical protein, putative [Bodo saltans]|eukprot:CUG93977.1 Hypothetical protein, putative [Bodo saltans]
MLPRRKRARSPTGLNERICLEERGHCSRRHRVVTNPILSTHSCLMDTVDAVTPPLVITAPRWAQILSSPICAEMIAVAGAGDVVNVRDAVVAVAAGAMDAHSVRLVSLVVYRVASLNEEAAALLAVECVRDALVAMSTHAGTSSAVRWVSLALHAVTSGSRCVKELFATLAVRDALVYLSMQMQAMTPSAVEAVSLALGELTCIMDSHEEAFLSKCVRDGLLSMVGNATTPRSIERLAKAFEKCIALSRCKTFMCTRVRDALLTMCAAATTAECVCQVADTLDTFDVVQYPLVSRMVTTCEVRDAVVMLASRATTSKCSGFVAATFAAVLRKDWDTGAPEIFGTSTVHDALVGLVSRATEPVDVSVCAGAMALESMAQYATTSDSVVYSIKGALIALKPTYRAGSLPRVFAALTATIRLCDSDCCDD